MTTVDRLDIAVHIQYAERTYFIEKVLQEYRLQEADSIPAQIQVVDIFPRLTELDLLLGVVPRHAPWAYFYPPKRYKRQRKSPFAFHRVIPSLGSLEKQDSDDEKLASIQCNTDEEREEKTIISSCFAKIREINDLIGFVIGRVGQFLQG